MSKLIKIKLNNVKYQVQQFLTIILQADKTQQKEVLNLKEDVILR